MKKEDVKTEAEKNNELNPEVDSHQAEASETETQKALDPLEELQEHNTKLKNEYLYLRAEFDNFRKNSIKERSELIKYGPERMVSSLLDVVDIFEKALSSDVNSDNLESFVEGVKMTSTELNKTLEKFGVKPVDSLKQAFDPNLHEAIGSEESSEVEPGFITQVFKKPYKFHDKVIRHGQVVISKAPSNESADKEK